ncbi:hypothetical protein, partial [Mesorhizobium sp.]|uniref:hypothetical protein n=1 Tax=Mesorhizobium sp. TaxID=1871066 RepID=UPI003458E333
MKTNCDPCWQAASPLPVFSKRSRSSGRARISSTSLAARTWADTAVTLRQLADKVPDLANRVITIAVT